MDNKDSCFLVLSNGDKCLVDSDLFSELSQFNWHRGGTKGYVMRNTWCKDPKRRGVEYLHVRINQTPAGLKTDHINGDVLDNRRINLRTVTDQQNFWNQAKRSKSTSSKYKGVCWSKEKQKWQTNIFIAGKLQHIGRFETEQEAAIAYNTAAERHFGQYARLNVL